MRTKRVVALSVTVAAIVLGVAVAVFVWRGEPARTQDAGITAIGADGRIEWNEVRFVHAEVDDTIAEDIPGTHHAGQLSDSATFFVALGETGNGVMVDASGAGTSPISREKFLDRWRTSLYAVQLTIKDGLVIKVAEYYHP